MLKNNLGKAYIKAATIYKIFLISVIKKLKNTDFIENIKFNIKDIETKDIFLIGKTNRDLIQEIFHTPVMLLNEIIHELHVLFFPTKSAEHKQKWKNDLLEIYTKERSNTSSCFFLMFWQKGWKHSLGTVGKSLDGFGNEGQISGSFFWREF